MKSEDPQMDIERLREEIRHHEYRYYVLDDPEITDAQFDQLMNQLKRNEAEHPELITPDSPTQRVGGKPREGFVKVPHTVPMLSLDNAYKEEDLRNWERRVHELSGRKDVEFVCELKLDGMSLALRYESGKLLRVGENAAGKRIAVDSARTGGPGKARLDRLDQAAARALQPPHDGVSVEHRNAGTAEHPGDRRFAHSDRACESEPDHARTSPRSRSAPRSGSSGIPRIVK